MRLGRPSQPQDPEKNSAAHTDSTLIARLISRIFPEKKPAVPEEILDHWEKDPALAANLNLFSTQFRGAAKVTYSKTESEQTATKLWSTYIDEAERYDSALVNSWKGDMEGILIFSGLFSASLTAFLIESYKNLQPDSGDRTVEILSQISLQLGALSASITLPESSQSDIPAFQPTLASLVCNTLWFISLCLSITCALLATLVEQWARDFLHKSEMRPSPIRRARIVSFLYFGLRRFGLHEVVDVIPLLLHVALILFLGGLIAFLLPINHMMVVLISVVLALFLVLYAILTLLPLLYLDCPYRTPFTGLFWNLLRNIRFRKNLAQPSGSASINDAMVRQAMEHSESRDRRAFAWTMDSLTDDAELSPFVEAIPEAIHGIHGFHLTNDHLFIPLLNQGSLGGRIGDLLLSYGNMASTDPQCSRGLHTCVKAIWALGMISGRTGVLFDHGGNIWFDKRIQDALHQPPASVLPLCYKYPAQVSINYSRMNNFRNRIARLVQALELGHHSQPYLVQETQDILTMANTVGAEGRSDALDSHLESLRVLHQNLTTGDPTLKMLELLSSIIAYDVWLEVNVSIVLGFLVDTANNLTTGEDLPYECVQTCLKIVPLVSAQDLTVPRMKRHLNYHQHHLAAVDPSRHSTMYEDILAIHWVMRCFLRIFPLLHLDDGVPIVAAYLTKCKDFDGVQFALQDCLLPHLMDSLVAILVQETRNTDITLAAIHVVFILPQFQHHMYEWNRRDDLLWNYLVEHDLLASPVPSVIPTLMISRKLTELKKMASKHFGKDQGEIDIKDVQVLRNLAANPLLPPFPEQTVSSLTPPELRHSIESRVIQGIIRSLAEFLRSCLEPVRPVYMYNALCRIRHWLPASLKDVDSTLATTLANNSLLLAKSAVDKPEDHELIQTTGTLFLWLQRALKKLCPPEAIPTFKEAVHLYLQFLDTRSDLDRSLEFTRNGLADLTVRWNDISIGASNIS